MNLMTQKIVFICICHPFKWMIHFQVMRFMAISGSFFASISASCGKKHVKTSGHWSPVPSPQLRCRARLGGSGPQPGVSGEPPEKKKKNKKDLQN